MLRLSRKSEYGLIALKFMLNRGAGTLSTAREIATRFKIPEQLLAKILQKLVKSGIIMSTQGVHGGYVLAMAPEKITIARIVESIEGPVGIVDCMVAGEECQCAQFEEGVCNIDEPFARIQKEFKNFLDGISLADLNQALPRKSPLVQIQV
jgi:Rrf2 family protein